MNTMLGRLETASTRQRQFVSDASHEMRSPVAAIRADPEVALAEGDHADWPSVATAVLAEESRLEALLADLLILAAGDEAPPPPDGATVDLAALARAEAERPHTVPVTVAGDVTATVPGSREQLARVVTNLVDNAARHARARVEVTVGRVPGPGEPTCWRLAVDDDGPGVPAGDRERVFERFTRLDDARARDAGGAGLGLAVVRSIVGRHRGAAWVEDGPLGGARFVVELPAAGRVPAPA
jgi:signal transduction histidine kinase